MSTTASGLKAQLADGSIVSASFAGLSNIHIPHHDSSTILSVTFDALAGNDSVLFSLPLLSGEGYSFLLTDRCPSLMVTPEGTVYVLRRQRPPTKASPHGAGFWHIDVRLSNDNVATLANDVFTFASTHDDQSSALSFPLATLLGISNLPKSLASGSRTAISSLSPHASLAPSLHQYRWSGRCGADSVLFRTPLPGRMPKSVSTSVAPLPPPLAHIVSPLEPSSLHTNTSSHPIPVRSVHTTRGRKRRRAPLTGIAAHAAWGHPTPTRARLWRKVVDNFPGCSFPARCSCWACNGAFARFQPVPSSSPLPGPTPPPCTRWSLDFSRTWDPDLQGFTGFILFTEIVSWYVRLYLIRSHTDIWIICQRHVDWVRSSFNTHVDALFGDHDPCWTKFGGTDADTFECSQFSTRNGLRFRRSPPETHAMCPAENRMGIINGLILVQLQFGRASNKLWGYAALNSATLHNFGPIMGSAKPLLKDGTPPWTVLFGRRVDASLVIAPFFALCWAKVYNDKPSKFEAKSYPCMYLGLAQDTIGWIVLPLSSLGQSRPKTAVTYHLVVDTDMSQRPAALASHDDLLSTGSPFTLDGELHHRMLRDLFASAPNNTSVDSSCIVYSPLTHAPIALTPMMDPHEHSMRLIEADTATPPDTTAEDTSTNLPASQTRNPAPTRRSRALSRGDTSGLPPRPRTRGKAPRTLASRLADLPLDTTLRLRQVNPKRPNTKSFRRYDSYKRATSIKEFWALGAARGDLAYDYEHGFLELPTISQISMLQAHLALAHLNDADPSVLLSSPTDATSVSYTASVTPPSTPLCYSPHTDVLHTFDVTYTAYCNNIAPAESSHDLHDYHPSCAASPPRLNPLASPFMPPDNDNETSNTTVAAVTPSGPPPDPPTPIRNTVKDLSLRIGDIAKECGLRSGPDVIEYVTDSVSKKIISLSAHDTAPDDVLDYITSAFSECTPVMSVSDGKAPASIADLLSSSDVDEWITALLAELYQLLDKYKTFYPVPRSAVDDARKAGRTVRIVPMKWVLVYKFNGTMFNRRKARLVACEAVGRFQVSDTWSPTVSLDSVRILFVLAAVHRMEVLSLDIAGAYLLGERKEGEDAIFLRLPQGLDAIQAARVSRGESHDPRLDYRSSTGEPMLWYCARNLYGLQSAGQTFWYVARDWLLSLTFEQCDSDPCIFFLRRDDRTKLIIGLYVDDSLNLFLDTLIKQWYLTEFELFFDQSPDSGPEHPSFLSIDYTISDDRQRIKLNTPKLWHRLEQAVSGFDLPTAKTPLPVDILKIIDTDTSVDNPLVPESEFHVRRVLGIASWGILAVRPGCAFSAALIARYASRPTRILVNSLLHLCSYLLRHKSDSLTIDATRDDKWETYVDSSWANDPSSMRSWFGYCLVWAGCPFAFRAKLEPGVTLATRDAECVAAVFAVKAMLSVLIMLHQLGFTTLDDGSDILPLPLHVDNSSTVAGSHSDKVHRDSRFLGMKLRWLRQMVRDGIVNITHIKSGDNLADIFTKPLSHSEHSRLDSLLMSGLTAIHVCIPTLVCKLQHLHALSK